MYPEFIFEKKSLENSRKNWSFEKYLECYILYVRGISDFLSVDVSLTFCLIISCVIHCFYNHYVCAINLTSNILRYCMFLMFQLDKINV